MNVDRPSILVAHAVFPEIENKLRQYFDVEITPPDVFWTASQLIAKLQGKMGVMTTGCERVDAALLAGCPQLKIAANIAVGYNNFDLPAMTAAGVLGTNTPDVLTETTADFGFALLMATARRLTESEYFLRRGLWKEWAVDLFMGAEVHASTMGILGMGRIGQAIARRGALGFGMKVIYHNRSRLDAAQEAVCQAQYVDKDELFAKADHVVLALPYTSDVHHTVGAAEIARMKPTVTLVNIARGGILDEDALVTALRERRIAAAGLDVFEGEPKFNPSLLTVPNVVLTPHIGSASASTRRAMAMLAADNLIAYLTKGKALTPLNPQVMTR